MAGIEITEPGSNLARLYDNLLRVPSTERCRSEHRAGSNTYVVDYTDAGVYYVSIMHAWDLVEVLHVSKNGKAYYFITDTPDGVEDVVGWAIALDPGTLKLSAPEPMAAAVVRDIVDANAEC